MTGVPAPAGSGREPDTRVPDRRVRVWARRAVVAVVVLGQAFFVVRAYGDDHKVLGFQMFPEASTWQAEVVRVTADGRRVPVDQGWPYRWADLTRGSSVARPEARQHADAGLDNTLAYLRSALAYVAAHTPEDGETRYLEAVVTAWPNTRGPEVLVLRSPERDVG